MSRAIVFLLVGLFLVSGVCLAADNRGAMETAGATPALIGEVVAAVQPVADQGTSAIIQVLTNLKAGKNPAEQGHIDAAINSLPRNWVGVDYPASTVSAVATAAANVQPTASPVATEVLQAVTAGLGVAMANTPQVKIIPQAQMAGVIGPMFLVAENVIVIGDQDWKVAQALPSWWAHEFAEAAGAANGLAKKAAHDAAQRVEDKVRAQGVKEGNQAEITAQIATMDAERMFNTLQALPQGAKVNIKARADFANRADLAAGLDVVRSRLGDANVTVNYTLPADGSLGVFQVEVLDAAGNPINQCRIDTKIQPYRLNGLLTEGLIGASIPAMKADEALPAYQARVQPTMDLLKEQHRANTNGKELVITADPRGWPAAVNRIAVELPAPAAINVDEQMEQEIGRQIFGKMA